MASPTPVSSPTPTPTEPVSLAEFDLDGNGMIGPGDVYRFAESMRENGTVDFTGDGTTGPDDLFVFIRHWGKSVSQKQK